MRKVTIKIDIDFDHIEELRRTEDRRVIIFFKSGDKLTFTGEKGKKVFNVLRRNFPGENLD